MYQLRIVFFEFNKCSFSTCLLLRAAIRDPFESLVDEKSKPD